MSFEQLLNKIGELISAYEKESGEMVVATISKFEKAEDAPIYDWDGDRFTSIRGLNENNRNLSK